MANEIVAKQTINYQIQELKELAGAFVACGFYGFRDPSQALVLMLKARADGVDPMTAADQYSIIQGRPALKSEAILVRFQAAGGKIAWRKREDEICTLWLSHPQGGELEVTWNKDRAIKAGLWNKDNFKKHPAQMLAARCISEGVRALFPACLSGCYTPEETVFFNEENQHSTAKAPRYDVPSHGPSDPVNEALDAVENSAKAKATAKKAKAVEAEVVNNEPEEIQATPEDLNSEDSRELDPKAEAFKKYMEDLRKSNEKAFDNAWGAYEKTYGKDFTKVPEDQRQLVYSHVKKSISVVAAANVNNYLEG